MDQIFPLTREYIVELALVALVGLGVIAWAKRTISPHLSEMTNWKRGLFLVFVTPFAFIGAAAATLLVAYIGYWLPTTLFGVFLVTGTLIAWAIYALFFKAVPSTDTE